MPPQAEHRPPDRRNFLRTAAAGLTLTAQSYANVAGSNSRIGLGFLGCGGRAQAHLHAVQSLAKSGVTLAPVAVCDVWDGCEDEYSQTFGGNTTRRVYRQGLHPTATAAGLNPADPRRVVKDFRRLLELKEVDAVCVATPDHWHARMTLDALAAGKHVFVERPLARTASEALLIREAAAASNRVVSVGVQSLADPAIAAARDLVRNGKIGPAVHMSGGAFRNDVRGQWRFYRVVSEMNRGTVDWDLFLGHRFEVNGAPLGPTPGECPFAPERFAQWRCESEFSGGPVSEMLYPVVARLLAVTDARRVTRTTTLGGTLHETDGRTVPDLVTVAAEFAEGCHLSVTATTLSNYPVEEVVRGRHGALKLVKGGVHVYRDDPAKGTTYPSRMERTLPPAEAIVLTPPRNETEELWRDFAACIVSGNKQTMCPPDLGAAAVAVLG
ncbi:MAG: Gfo/Idh/MocA family oxidoreductase [Gemmataceae bacterium]